MAVSPFARVARLGITLGMVLPVALAATVAAASPAARPLVLLPAFPAGTTDAPTSARLQALLDTMVGEGLPDVLASVVTPDGSWSGAAGVDGPDGRLAAPPDIAAIASVSKLFEAATAMRLVEGGKLDLDAPLASYLEGLDIDANGASIGQALAMRSGIGGTSPDAQDRVVADCGHEWTRNEVIATFPEPMASPGAEAEYSNPTYKMLGYAIESASGQPLADAIASEVLAPVGEEAGLFLQGPGNEAPQPWALPVEGHTGGLALDQFGTGDTLPCMAAATLALGGAGMAGDVGSLARWGWELYGGRVVSRESLALMMPTDGYGLGMETWPDDFTVPTYGHTGITDGYKAILAYQPTEQAVVAAIINDGDADEIGVARRLFGGLRPAQ